MHSIFYTDSTRCPATPEVILDHSCHRKHNETCSFTCEMGYKPTNISQPNNVTCTTSSAWDKPLSSLCEKLKCPATIPHGNISTICSREYNTECLEFKCDNGYIRGSSLEYKFLSLKCNAGHWEWLQSSALDFCVNEDVLCPSAIKNGHFNRCRRREGYSCYYNCDGGCKRHSVSVTCHNKTWDTNTDMLCTECIPCNLTIPHGSINGETCYGGKDCWYTCDNEMTYAKNENITQVVCSNSTNTWLPSIPSANFSSESDLCIARRCSTNIPNGHLLASCSPMVGSICRYKCDSGYHGDVSEITCLSGHKEIMYSRLSWKSEVFTLWSVDERKLCTNSQQCPLVNIPNGYLDQACRRNPGDVCSFTCQKYVYRPVNQTTVTCTSSSTWDTSFSQLCEEIVCPSTIPNGSVNCLGRSYNQKCYSYSCNTGFKPSAYFSSLICNREGRWEWTKPSPLKISLAEEELCPSTISGGRISSDCHRLEGSTCTYHCSECKNRTADNWLTCHNKTWGTDTGYITKPTISHDTTTPTTSHDTTTTTTSPDTTSTTTAPVRCSSLLSGGRVNSSCNRIPKSTCGFQCDPGCTKQLNSIQCDRYGEWISGSTACNCSTTCPSHIPNGYIPVYNYILGLCDFKPGSTCDLKCNKECVPRYSTAICNAAGQWTDANYLCYCYVQTSSKTDTSNGDSISTITIVMSVIGGIVFLIMVAFVITSCHRRRSQQAPYHMSLVLRKPVFGVSDQVPHKPGCRHTEDG